MMFDWDFIRGRRKPLPRRAPSRSAAKLITVNGCEHEIEGADLSDMQVATRIRMLMRGQLDHEGVCTLARDRIVYLADQLALRDAGAPPPAPEGETVLRAFVIVREPGCVPDKKGPFPPSMVSKFVRELIACRPAGTAITVARLTWNHDLWVDDGREMVKIEDSLSDPETAAAIDALFNEERSE